jgi:aquaglyceroporin related protein
MRDRSSMADDRTHFTTLAGPEQTIQLAQTYENYVSPGYTDLNPSYEQPASAKPVWSLAKPLPRVVRSGMVPSRDEIFESRQNAELPIENSQKLGLDVDPTDLEEGRVRFHPNPLVLAAQLKDSRTQREHNYINNLVAAEQEGTLERKTSRISAVTSATNPSRRARASTGISLHDRPISQTDGDIADENLHDPELDAIPEALTPPELDMPHHGLDEHMATIPESRVPSRVPSKEDTRSLSTLAPEDDDEWPNLDPFKTVEHPVVFEEVHNNHTGWSVIRTQYREFLAEFLAVFMQLTMGFCVDIAHTVMNSSNPNYTAWGWGFATMVGIYVSGGISGAHLNPAITLMLWFFRGFPKRKMPEYWCAQLLGAFAAAFTAYGLYRASIANYLVTNNYSAQAQKDIANSFVTSQRFDYIDPATAFFNEFVGTAMLAATVLALGDDQNAPPGAGMNSLIIGFVISLETFAFSYQSGAALNPTRDLGPRLALLALGYGKQLFTNPYWFYGPWVGTITGAFVGACMYDIAIFTGGESPINCEYRHSRGINHMRMKANVWCNHRSLVPHEALVPQDAGEMETPSDPRREGRARIFALGTALMGTGGGSLVVMTTATTTTTIIEMIPKLDSVFTLE